MKAREQELLRKSLLTQLYPVGSTGLAAETLCNGAIIDGFEVSLETVTAELDRLDAKGQCAAKASALAAGARRYVITGAGIDLVESEGWVNG